MVLPNGQHAPIQQRPNDKKVKHEKVRFGLLFNQIAVRYYHLVSGNHN